MPPKAKSFSTQLPLERWVIVSLGSISHNAAQIPLPYNHNGISGSIDRDEIQLLPYFIVEGLKNDYLPSYRVNPNDPGQEQFMEDKFSFNITEIPDEYQTPEGVRELLKETEDPEHPFHGLKMKISRFPDECRNNGEWALKPEKKFPKKPKKSKNASEESSPETEYEGTVEATNED